MRQFRHRVAPQTCAALLLMVARLLGPPLPALALSAVAVPAAAQPASKAPPAPPDHAPALKCATPQEKALLAAFLYAWQEAFDKYQQLTATIAQDQADLAAKPSADMQAAIGALGVQLKNQSAAIQTIADKYNALLGKVSGRACPDTAGGGGKLPPANSASGAPVSAPWTPAAPPTSAPDFPCESAEDARRLNSLLSIWRHLYQEYIDAKSEAENYKRHSGKDLSFLVKLVELPDLLKNAEKDWTALVAEVKEDSAKRCPPKNGSVISPQAPTEAPKPKPAPAPPAPAAAPPQAAPAPPAPAGPWSRHHRPVQTFPAPPSSAPTFPCESDRDKYRVEQAWKVRQLLEQEWENTENDVQDALNAVNSGDKSAQSRVNQDINRINDLTRILHEYYDSWISLIAEVKANSAKRCANQPGAVTPPPPPPPEPSKPNPPPPPPPPPPAPTNEALGAAIEENRPSQYYVAPPTEPESNPEAPFLPPPAGASTESSAPPSQVPPSPPSGPATRPTNLPPSSLPPKTTIPLTTPTPTGSSVPLAPSNPTMPPGLAPGGSSTTPPSSSPTTTAPKTTNPTSLGVTTPTAPTSSPSSLTGP